MGKWNVDAIVLFPKRLNPFQGHGTIQMINGYHTLFVSQKIDIKK